MSSRLDELCDRYGVLPGYFDMWGNAYQTSERARRALLAAMGVPAASDDEIAASLFDFDRDHWARPLPPVMVVREGTGPHRIAVSFAEDDEVCTWRWCLRRESGWEDRGTFMPSGLGEEGRAHVDGRDFVRRVLPLELTVEPGYHRLVLERADGGGPPAEMSFIVAPSCCYEPPAIQGGRRVWGFAAQLYAIRSQHNWGMGDFGDLRRMIEFCAEAGASTLLLNPVHALFPDAPEHASPYSPSSRAWFNTLYLDVEAIADFGESEEARDRVGQGAFQAQLDAMRAAVQVDYRSVAEAKAGVLECLYAHFRARHLAQSSDRVHAFRAFQAWHGDALRKQALFDALQAHFHAEDSTVWGWPAWPPAYHDPQSAPVAAFCDAHLDRVEYFEYLQWQASIQIDAVGARSWECGLGVGLMLDLAIGVAEGGAATWMQRDLHALQASAGAPPDEINRMGQDWGLPPWIPHRLTASSYAPFIELLRANMRAAGALRIDHVMGLRRLFWVARGLPVAEGAYVQYPFEDLLGILALESQRNRCMVVGEDLGTVPDEVRHALQPMNVMSTRLMYFERCGDGRMKPPSDYPGNAMVAVTTHDLPTLAAFWDGSDIDLRERLQLFPNQEVLERQRALRVHDRAQLLGTLRAEGLLADELTVDSPFTASLAAAVYAHLARAPSKLLLVQVEDGFGVLEQPNLPGTVAPTYPCWRLKLPAKLEQWADSSHMQGIVHALRQARPR
ncbi:MAG: 4-alpha-glucanotransferase [Azoarcus sp.]|nr:4-alpha-glucanotransferase [Azoarcus sp.]